MTKVEFINQSKSMVTGINDDHHDNDDDDQSSNFDSDDDGDDESEEEEEGNDIPNIRSILKQYVL